MRTRLAASRVYIRHYSRPFRCQFFSISFLRESGL